jgi:hypothetical protein
MKTTKVVFMNAGLLLTLRHRRQSGSHGKRDDKCTWIAIEKAGFPRRSCWLIILYAPDGTTAFFHGKQGVDIAVTPAQAPEPG